MTTKLIGTTLISVAEFRNENNTKITPSSVNIKYKKPVTTGVTTTSISADGTGRFIASVLLDEVGIWKFRWESTSGTTAAEEFSVTVTDTSVK